MVMNVLWHGKQQYIFFSLKYVNSLRRLLHHAEDCTKGCTEDKEGFYRQILTTHLDSKLEIAYLVVTPMVTYQKTTVTL